MREVLRVLLGEELGRRHQRRLVACFDGIAQPRARRRSSCRNRRRPARDAASGCGTERSLPDLGDHALLCAGQRESRAGEQSRRRTGPARRSAKPVTADFGAQLAERQLVGQQFLESEASLRGWRPASSSASSASGGGRCIHWSAARAGPGMSSSRRILAATSPASPPSPTAAERLRVRFRSRPCCTALRDRIDRGRDVLHGLGVRRGGVLYIRDGRFPGRACRGALAKAAQALAAHELPLLRAAEVEEAQRQETGAVGEAQEQGAPPAEDAPRQSRSRLRSRRACRRQQRTDRHDARAVLVARRQPGRGGPRRIRCRSFARRLASAGPTPFSAVTDGARSSRH